MPGVGPYLIAAIPVDVGVVFLAAAVTKAGIAAAVYPGGRRVWRCAVDGAGDRPVVIASEGFLAAALLAGRMVAVASLITGGWLAVVPVATVVNLRRGRTFPCYCFHPHHCQLTWRRAEALEAWSTAVALIDV